MELLPNDVRQHRFSKSVRGYATDEVDQFLEHVATVLEDALEARQKADEAAHRLERDIERFRDQEGALKKAVFTVEQAMETARASSMKEVEAIRREAEGRARQILQEAELESRRLEQDMKFLKDSRQGMIEQIRAFCKAQLATLEGLDLPERTREASRQGVMPRPGEAARPVRPPQPAPPAQPVSALPERLDTPVRGEADPAAAKSPRRWQPERVERVERDEVDARISEALGVDDAAVVYPPPLVPDSRAKGDR
jgi:cell division initiation protein